MIVLKTGTGIVAMPVSINEYVIPSSGSRPERGMASGIVLVGGLDL